MTTTRYRGDEAHPPWHSASHQEPPTADSLPTSDEGVTDQRILDEWGNSMEKKQASTLRIMFQNVGGFSKEEEMGIKLAALRRTIGDRQTDIFGFTEANTCWDVVADNLRLPRQTRGWWENSQWSLSHNRLEKDNPAYQPGGTGIVCVNQVAHKTLKPGDDQSGLG